MFKVSEAVPYLNVLQLAQDLGWKVDDGDLTPSFERAHLHDHDDVDSLLFDVEGCDGSVAKKCKYQWVVLNDPERDHNGMPDIIVYRVKFKYSNGGHRYYYYIK